MTVSQLPPRRAPLQQVESGFDAEGAISPIEEIIEAALNGQPYILVDAEDRENEGDVIIPAQFATPAQINFMAKHARGLICLAMTSERATQLRLPPMTYENRAGHSTAFTVSIEAKEGVTTGISAHDRAHTIAVATDPSKGEADLVSPGHIFPLVAKPGGVLVRAGHTEAAVDISRLAGLHPAGVICEVMNDDGTMARLPDLVAFAQTHGLKIGTIADLIAYRRRTERFVTRVHEEPYDSIYGSNLRLSIFRSTIDGTEHVAIAKGRIAADTPALVRVHQIDFTSDLLSPTSVRRNYIPAAIKAIAEHDGPGVVVLIRDSSPQALSDRYSAGGDVPHEKTIRDYGMGAQILIDLGVRDMILLTSNQAKLSSIEGYGLRIVDRRPLGDDDQE